MKKLALSGLVLGMAMAVSAAQAEPLTLSEGQMDGVTAGGFGFVQFDAFVQNNFHSMKNINFDKDARVDVQTDIDGWLADAEAGANCFGFGCTAETKALSDARADSFTATAFSSAISAADFPENNGN
jgi:hypothetical protein